MTNTNKQIACYGDRIGTIYETGRHNGAISTGLWRVTGFEVQDGLLYSVAEAVRPVSVKVGRLGYTTRYEKI